MKKLILLFFAFHFSFSIINAQSWLWGRQGTGDIKANAYGGTVATDKQGNAYMTSDYETTITFGTYTLNNYYDGMYLVKYNSAGVVQWAIQPIQKSSLDYSYSTNIASDIKGNVFITGLFGDTVNFNGNTLIGQPNLYGTIFLAKYNSNGKGLWAVKSSNIINEAHPIAVATDTAGNVFLSGYFKDTVTFGPYILKTGMNDCVFLVKYDSNGNLLWARQSNLPSVQSAAYSNSVATDKTGNAYLTGFFSDTVTFGAYSLNFGNAVYDVTFLVKYDPNGNVLWAKQSLRNSIHSAADAYSVATDGTGSAYISGVFYDTIKFGSYILKCKSINKYGQLFLAKYDNNGNVVWAEESSGGSVNDGYSFTRLSSDSNNHIYMLFETDSVFVFGGKTFNIPNGIHPYLCTAIFNDSGKATCGSVMVKPNNKGNNGFAVDPSGQYIYTSGSVFEDTLIFGNDTLMWMLGSAQPYLARWKPCSLDDASVSNLIPNSANVILYPNPNNGLFTLSLSHSNLASYQMESQTIEIYNILGAKVYMAMLKPVQHDCNIDLSSQSNGIYFYRVIGTNRELTGEGKLIIQK